MLANPESPVGSSFYFNMHIEGNLSHE